MSIRRWIWVLLLLPVLVWAQLISVDIKSKTADQARLKRYKEAAGLLVEVVNSKEFRDEVLAYKFNGKPGFASTGDSPEEVLRKIINGSESLNPSIDHKWSWDVVFYWSAKSTVGYTYPNVTTLWVNTRFMDKYDLADIARNQGHEMMHKLGFAHDFEKTKRRPSSVPYAVGSMIERIGRAKLKGGPIVNHAPQPPPKTSKPWWRRIF